jgi:hypothetical protein
MADIKILYEDGEALVIDKPSGMSVDRPRKGGICLEDHLERLKLGFQRPPVAVHRLDTDTSGCLLLARNSKALARVQQGVRGAAGRQDLSRHPRRASAGYGRDNRAFAVEDQFGGKGLAHDTGQEGQAGHFALGAGG